MTAPPAVLELVDRFDHDLDIYRCADYIEARVRVEFIDPFFEALGWDVRNVQGRGEHDKDVIRLTPSHRAPSRMAGEGLTTRWSKYLA